MERWEIGMAEGKRVLLVTVHGIRTFGMWQERLNGLVRDANRDIDVATYNYGYFSSIAFAIPVIRYLAVYRFRKHLKNLLHAHGNPAVSIVAHSFGTHIVAHALRGMLDEMPRIHTLILA